MVYVREFLQKAYNQLRGRRSGEELLKEQQRRRFQNIRDDAAEQVEKLVDLRNDAERMIYEIQDSIRLQAAEARGNVAQSMTEELAKLERVGRAARAVQDALAAQLRSEDEERRRARENRDRLPPPDQDDDNSVIDLDSDIPHSGDSSVISLSGLDLGDDFRLEPLEDDESNTEEPPRDRSRPSNEPSGQNEQLQNALEELTDAVSDLPQLSCIPDRRDRRRANAIFDNVRNYVRERGDEVVECEIHNYYEELRQLIENQSLDNIGQNASDTLLSDKAIIKNLRGLRARLQKLAKEMAENEFWSNAELRKEKTPAARNYKKLKERLDALGDEIEQMWKRHTDQNANPATLNDLPELMRKMQELETIMANDLINVQELPKDVVVQTGKRITGMQIAVGSSIATIFGASALALLAARGCDNTPGVDPPPGHLPSGTPSQPAIPGTPTQTPAQAREQLEKTTVVEREGPDTVQFHLPTEINNPGDNVKIEIRDRQAGFRSISPSFISEDGRFQFDPLKHGPKPEFRFTPLDANKKAIPDVQFTDKVE